MRRLRWRGRRWRSWGFESTILLPSGDWMASHLPRVARNACCCYWCHMSRRTELAVIETCCTHRANGQQCFPNASLFGYYVLHHLTSIVIGSEFLFDSIPVMSLPILSRSAFVLPRASPASTISAIARARGAAALSKRPSLSLNNGSTQVPRPFLGYHRRQFSSSSATMASPSLTSIRSNCRKVQPTHANLNQQFLNQQRVLIQKTR